MFKNIKIGTALCMIVLSTSSHAEKYEAVEPGYNGEPIAVIDGGKIKQSTIKTNEFKEIYDEINKLYSKNKETDDKFYYYGTNKFDAIDRKVSDVEKKLSDLERKLSDSDRTISELKNTISRLESSNSTLQSQIQQLNSKIK